MSRAEKSWRDKRMGDRVRKSDDIDQSNPSVLEPDDESSDDAQARRLMKRGAAKPTPKPRSPRDKSAQSRVSFESELARASVHPRTPHKRNSAPDVMSGESQSRDLEEPLIPDLSKLSGKKSARSQLDSQPSSMRTAGNLWGAGADPFAS